jgi:aldose 1-epimerase
MSVQSPTLAISFGRVAGHEARLFTLQNERLTVRVTDYGGALVAIEAPDCKGRQGEVLLGLPDAAAYGATRGAFGALLGRNANRIAGGRFVLDDVPYELSRNENGSTLHGGAVGFDKRFWSVAAAESTCLELTLVSEDGDQGFPGRVEVTARYELAGAELRLAFAARTTKPTPLSLSAHPYFNLEGPHALDCLGHLVEIPAGEFLPTDERQIPTGERRSVAGTPFDFTTARAIGERIRQPDAQLVHGRGYDHYYILSEGGGALRRAARVTAPGSGRSLEILTTQPGVQFYTGNKLDGTVRGRSGLYRQSAGFAFEPQGFPDAVNQPNFPSTVLRPKTAYREEIVYRFGIE